MQDLSTDEQQIMISILASTDAIHWPFRDPRADWWATGWHARREFALRGIPWTPGSGRSESDRKASERSLFELCRRKLAVRFGRGVRTSHVRLTNRGDQTARALVGLATMFDAVTCCRNILDAGPDGRWVPETAFTSGKGWGDGCQSALALFEMLHLPGAIRGWIETNATVRGHVCYRLTPSGRQIASSDLDPMILRDLPDELDGGFDSYLGELASARAALRSRDDDNQDIGRIPLSMATLEGC